MTDPSFDYDVIVIGGGAAGLAGALILGRSLRRVLVLDAGHQRNLPAEGIHAFLTRDGMSPAEFLAAGRAEVEGYGVEIRGVEAVGAASTADGFRVRSADGGSVSARRLLVTTGLTDELPDVPGLRERWGRDVVHCPYCHGYEVRGRAIGVLSSGPATAHQALLFRQLSGDVVVFAHTGPDPSADDLARYAALGIRVVPGEVTEVSVEGDAITGVRLDDGSTVARDVLVVAAPAVARASVLRELGLPTTPHPLGAALGEYVAPVDPTGRTAIPGVWVAGNVSDLAAQVITAAAAGNAAGAAINAHLVMSDAAAVTASAAGEPVAEK